MHEGLPLLSTGIRTNKNGSKCRSGADPDAGADADSNRFAEKYSKTRLDAMAKNHWLQMGLLYITFVTRTTLDGQLAIEV